MRPEAYAALMIVQITTAVILKLFFFSPCPATPPPPPTADCHPVDHIVRMAVGGGGGEGINEGMWR